MNNRFYTSVEQSRKLLKLGLNPESADMCYTLLHTEASLTGQSKYNDFPCVLPSFAHGSSAIPCWSLAALLNILHNRAKDIPSLSGGGYRDGKYISDWCLDYEFEDGDYQKTFADNPVDACYKMIVKLHELNLL